MRLLVIAWRHLAGWSYKFKAPDASKRETNCCIAVESILREWYPDAAWSSQTHRDLMILDAARPWSPIDACETAGVGRATASPVAGCWHLVQFWADPVRIVKGHTALYYEPLSPIADGPYVLEATNARVEFFRECMLAEKADGRQYRLAVLR